jgi:hypothetical protein
MESHLEKEKLLAASSCAPVLPQGWLIEIDSRGGVRVASTAIAGAG